MRCKACNAPLKDWEIEDNELMCSKCSGESYKQIYPVYPGLNFLYYPEDLEEDQDTFHKNKLNEDI